MDTHLVLVGGGHAHLFVLEGLARRRFPPGLAVTLVTSDKRHAYSGMVPGLLGGRYRPEELVLDLTKLARSAGAELVEGTVVGLNPRDRSITLADGRSLAFDFLSLAIGAANAGTELPGVRELALFVKPIDRTLGIVGAVERAVARSTGRGPATVVVGAGAAGIELALNLRARLRLLGRPGSPITVVDGGDSILADRSPACRTAAERALLSHGVRRVLGSAVARLDPGRVTLERGRSLEADLVVWATGPAPPRLVADTGLALDERGYVRVDCALRSTSHPQVFAAGDVASVVGRPELAKSGVYAVREGPVLRDNLAAAAAGRPAHRRFRPRRRFLALLNTGDGRAIFSYGDLALSGRWAMALKNRIDRRFVARFGR